MSQILDRVNSPGDVKSLKQGELDQLCSEIRELLVTRVTENGGHLASNLGAIELTIALHRVFDSPKDKIVWDVGHQSYVHKLLTGRKKLFPTLRQYNGLCGFPDPNESPHDSFIAGHAGNCISAALGMALARDTSSDNYHVIAVTGDGCLTCGITYEALNHAGHLNTNFIVVLNDNGMSISPTVGALARKLTMLRTSRSYKQTRDRATRLLRLLPGGRKLCPALHRLKQGIKTVIVPTMIWEQLGFSYLGPINGHSIAELETAFTHAKDCHKPILIHVLTTKGKGYAPAEDNPIHFHGLSPKIGRAHV